METIKKASAVRTAFRFMYQVVRWGVCLVYQLVQCGFHLAYHAVRRGFRLAYQHKDKSLPGRVFDASVLALFLVALIVHLWP